MQSTIAQILAIFINDVEHYGHVAVMMLWGLGLGACGFRGVAGYLGAKCSHGLVKLGLGGLSWWVYDKRVGGVLRLLWTLGMSGCLVRNVGGMFPSCCFSALYSWKRCKAGPALLRQETNHMKVSLRNITRRWITYMITHKSKSWWLGPCPKGTESLYSVSSCSRSCLFVPAQRSLHPHRMQHVWLSWGSI